MLLDLSKELAAEVLSFCAIPSLTCVRATCRQLRARVNEEVNRRCQAICLPKDVQVSHGSDEDCEYKLQIGWDQEFRKRKGLLEACCGDPDRWRYSGTQRLSGMLHGNDWLGPNWWLWEEVVEELREKIKKMGHGSIAQTTRSHSPVSLAIVHYLRLEEDMVRCLLINPCANVTSPNYNNSFYEIHRHKHIPGVKELHECLAVLLARVKPNSFRLSWWSVYVMRFPFDRHESHQALLFQTLDGRQVQWSGHSVIYDVCD